jgi:putative endonuclease
MSELFYVYILASRYRGTLYVGVTNNLSRRIGEHKSGMVLGFTKKYEVHILVYYEECGSILEARDRERALKRCHREWKFKLIEDVNPRWRDLTPDLIGSRISSAPLRKRLRAALHPGHRKFLLPRRLDFQQHGRL